MDKKDDSNPLAQVHDTLDKMETLGPESVFHFRCHKGLKCWGDCCKNPNLFLTPYDVIRLRGALKMNSGQFLEKFTESYVGHDFGLGVVRMKPNGRGECPFLAPEGCSVYQDRPTSCRTYPIGQGVSSGTGKGDAGKAFFTIKEDHCLGWREDTPWTVEKWLASQQVFDYNKENEFVVHLAFHPALGDPDKLDEKAVAMIFMALYDLDRFRQFVFKSSFSKRFKLDGELLEKARENDMALMEIGRRWISFFALQGETALPIREPGDPGKNESFE